MRQGILVLAVLVALLQELAALVLVAEAEAAEVLRVHTAVLVVEVQEF